MWVRIKIIFETIKTVLFVALFVTSRSKNISENIISWKLYLKNLASLTYLSPCGLTVLVDVFNSIYSPFIQLIDLARRRVKMLKKSTVIHSMSYRTENEVMLITMAAQNACDNLTSLFVTRYHQHLPKKSRLSLIFTAGKSINNKQFCVEVNEKLMNWHRLCLILVVFDVWLIVQASSINTAAKEGEYVAQIKRRSARAVFNYSTNNNNTASEWMIGHPYPSWIANSSVRATPRKPAELGWNLPTTNRPVRTTVDWLKKPLLTTENSTEKIGWIITTTPRTIQATRSHSKHSFGWNIPTTRATPRLFSTTNFHSTRDKSSNTTTQRHFNTVTTTPRAMYGWFPTTVKSQSSIPRPPSIIHRATTSKPPPTAIRISSTRRPMSTTTHFSIQTGWGTALPITTPRANFGWLSSTPQSPPVPIWKTPITTIKNYKIFVESTTTTDRPSNSIFQTRSTTRNPLGESGHKNFSSSDDGVWKKTVLQNSQSPSRPHSYPYDDNRQYNSNRTYWNENKNIHHNNDRYSGNQFVQTSNVIPQKSNKKLHISFAIAKLNLFILKLSQITWVIIS